MARERAHRVLLELHSEKESHPAESQREERKEVFERLPGDHPQYRRTHHEAEDDEVGTGSEKEPGAGSDFGGRKRETRPHKRQRDQDEGR